ncbi:MAG: helix-turn-helix transcriptional regulator [archaeon]
MKNPVKKLLDEKDISIKEVKEGLGVTRSTVYAWLQGNHMPSRANAQLLAKYAELSQQQQIAFVVSVKKYAYDKEVSKK